MRRCPQCQSERTRRSKRRGFVERGALTLLPLKPFRCRNCGYRFFRWPMTRSNFDATDPESANRPHNLRLIHLKREGTERDVNLPPYNTVHNRRNLGDDYATIVKSGDDH